MYLCIEYLKMRMAFEDLLQCQKQQRTKNTVKVWLTSFWMDAVQKEYDRMENTRDLSHSIRL